MEVGHDSVIVMGRRKWNSLGAEKKKDLRIGEEWLKMNIKSRNVGAKKEVRQIG
jgi:hypothetical protein